MQTNSNSDTKKNKILLKRNLEYTTHKKISDVSTDYFYSSNFSTKLTNTNIHNPKTTNLKINTPIITNQRDNYYTINEYSEEDAYLSKINLEYDIHISSLKKKLSMLKNNRKKAELNIMNLKKNINELHDKEIKSSKQLEYTKKYINKIMKSSKNNLNKNYGIIITKINNIYQNDINQGSIKLNINNSNNYKTIGPLQKSVASMTNPNLSHLACFSAIKNNFINNNDNQKLKSKRNLIKNQMKDKTNYIDYIKNCASPITNKIYIKKNITSIRKTKNYQNIKDNLIKRIKLDIDKKLKIEREIEKINREQNNLYNNFYENFVILRSAKTLDINE